MTGYLIDSQSAVGIFNIFHIIAQLRSNKKRSIRNGSKMNQCIYEIELNFIEFSNFPTF